MVLSSCLFTRYPELYNVSLVSTYVCNSGVWHPWPCWKGAKKLGNSCNCLWSYWRNCLAIAQQFFLSMRWKKGQPSLLFSRKKYMKFQSRNIIIELQAIGEKTLRLSFSTYVGKFFLQYIPLIRIVDLCIWMITTKF